MKIALFTIFVLSIFIISSCSKENDSISNPKTIADIIGIVDLFDENINIPDSGMHVKIEGLQPEFSATSDLNGKYILQGIPFGTYTLIYEKQGFGTFKNFGVEHNNTGSSTILSNGLSKISTTEVINLDAVSYEFQINISFKIYPAGSNNDIRYVRLFYGDSSSVSDENYTYFTPKLSLKYDQFELTLSQNDFIEMGFSSNTTVFIKIYGDTYFSNDYYDQDLGIFVFPNLNKNSADAVSFIVP
jgi:hypothetical protein